MAVLRVDLSHVDTLYYICSVKASGSAAGKANTGPFTQYRQAIVYAAALGYANAREGLVQSPSQVSIHDYTMLDAPGARELAFSIMYRDSGWDLKVGREDVPTSDERIRVLERYAAGGLAILKEALDVDKGLTAQQVMVSVQRRSEKSQQSVAPPDPSGRDPLLDLIGQLED